MLKQWKTYKTLYTFIHTEATHNQNLGNIHFNVQSELGHFNLWTPDTYFLIDIHHWFCVANIRKPNIYHSQWTSNISFITKFYTLCIYIYIYIIYIYKQIHICNTRLANSFIQKSSPTL